MDLHSSLEQFQASFRVPPAPHVVTNLFKKLQEPEPDIEQIVDIVSGDKSLEALVLKTVNSPLFGLNAKVTSIQRAANLLGLACLTNIVMALALKHSFEADDGLPENFWDAPFKIACLAVSLAHRVSGVSADQAYLLGLFHNAGQALMLQKYPAYAELLQRFQHGGEENVCELEERLFGTHHATLGYFLARSWGLPKMLAEMIYQHHHFNQWYPQAYEASSDSALLLAVLKMAEHIEHLHCGAASDPEWQQISAQVLLLVGFSELDFTEIKADLLEKLALDGEDC